MGSKSRYRIVLKTRPWDGNVINTFSVEKYVTRESPNGDYWADEGISAGTAELAKQKLIDKLTKKTVIEEFTL